MEKKYADVIVGISHEKIDRAFQYIVPQHLQTELEIGMCVHIPFGRGNHIQEGYVIGFSEQAELPDDKLKEIRQIVPASVKATERSIQLAAWIRSYYGCTMIAALKTVLPVKQEKKAVVYREVTLAVTENEAREYLCQAQKKHQAAKVRLLEALLEGAALSYTMVTGKLAVSPQTVTGMAAQGILRVESYETYRNPVHFDELPGEKKKLTEVQQEIADDFIRSYDAGDRTPVLLHGITGSGKTEVYMEMIDAMLQRGKQCIVLIPEIALTYQTLLRFYKRFGDAVSVMHSRLSAGERYDQMKRAKRGEVQVMIGPRSALFTPFQKLGLIIIDEEHETSYKSDSMPKYHAREVAVHLAEMTDACVVMGSATPSLEANYRAQQGIYKKYVLSERIGDAVLPEVQIVDMRQELAGGNSSIFSRHLETAIADRLEKRQQVMLFLNRRGISGFVSCRACGYVMKCPHCDVSLSEHRQKMVCHYCGYEEPKPSVCPKCQSRYLFGFKAGTQQVEDSLRLRFPEARILRMDADTTKKKDDYEKILAVFANRDADILIGTQMIVKGHDFPGVTLMGVLAADLSFLAADYRSGERTFQLLVQAVGRAGRGSVAGEAVIQTYQPDHYSVVYAAKQDYDGFYQEEMAYRKLLGYPPAAHMLAVLFTGKNEKETLFWAEQMLSMLRRQTRERKDLVIIGPAPASIGRINDMFRQIAYFKSPDETLLMRLRGWMELFCQKNEDKMRSLLVYYDMDPVHGY